MTAADDRLEQIAARYRRFAAEETEGISPLYTALSRAVAEHRPTLEFLGALPPLKQQPNLLLAAVRSVAGTPLGPEDFLAALHHRPERIRAVMLARSNQMNEPARCGVVLPLLAGIEGPISLIEVGASAGLCLLPDRYHYRYHREPADTAHAGTVDHRLGSGAVTIDVAVSGPVPLPTRMPEIAWRAGLDLNPIDLTDAEERDWLRSLIWPEHAVRAARLEAAMELAQAERHRIVAGDLRHDLPALVAQAPADTTVVVIHSAVLVYLQDRADIDRFVTTIEDLGVRWVSNEHPQVLPDANRAMGDRFERDFSLMLDGEPVAAAGPHGQSLRWF